MINVNLQLIQFTEKLYYGFGKKNSMRVAITFNSFTFRIIGHFKQELIIFGAAIDELNLLINLQISNKIIAAKKIRKFISKD